MDTMICVWSLEYVRRRVGRGVNKAKSFLSARDVHRTEGGVLRATTMYARSNLLKRLSHATMHLNQ